MGLRSTRIGFCLSVAGTADVQRRAMMQQLASVQWLTSSPLAQMARPRCSARCTWVSLWLFRVPCRTTPNCKALTRSRGRADRFTAYSRKKTLADSLQNGKHRNDGSKWATNHVLCPVCCATLTGAAYPRSRGGTWAPWWPGRSMHGLSPLARGNLNGGGYWVKSVGPIPARAGEPAILALAHVPDGAYPRSRGGTPTRSRHR